MAKKTIAEKEAELMSKKETKKQEVERFSTFITHLDCILSEGEDSTQWGYPVGKVIGVNSKSKGGKTQMALEALFSMLRNYGKDSVDYLYLDAESGMSIDTDRRYGFPLKNAETLKAEKSKAPPTLKEIHLLEEFQVESHNFCDNKDKDHKGFIVLDSLDGVGCAATEENLETRTKEYKKEGTITKVKTYGADKPKLLAEIMPLISSKASNSKTTIFFIHHQKEKMNALPFEKSTYVAGGTATSYYPSIMFELRRADTFGEKELETGYLLEVFVDKARTAYERRRVYIAIDHTMGYDPIKSDLIYLYDLITDRRQFDAKKASALKWDIEWDPNSASEPVEAITDEQYKKFAEDNNLVDDIRSEFGNIRVNNIKNYIIQNKEISDMLVKEFGVMDIDTMCGWIEENGLEEELSNRVKSKFFAIERSLRKVERKSRRL